MLLPWFSGYNRVYAAYGHTIALNGGNDFYGSETFFTSTRSPTYYFYITWDSTNLYVAYRGDEINKDDARFTNQSQKWVQMYIGGENGTTSGSPYRTQQPTLPFSAKYHVRWKIDETYFNVQQYNGSSWVDTAGSFGYYRDANSPFVKFKIPLSAIGNPTTLKFASFLLEETAGNERMWAAFPEDAFSDGYDRNVNTYYQFDLQSDSVSTRQVNYNFNSTSVTSNTADFSFNASSGASSVKIQQSTDGAVWTDAEMKQPLSASSTTGQVTGLTPGTAYKFRLVVTGGTSQGSSEVVDVTTPAGTPVSDLANVSVTNTTASFTWTPAAGASSVMMLQSADNGRTWTTAAAGR
ncbi:hypothetical protein ACP26L_11495 [Paenibacillus sp. S-38]|uniref:hypothetical protein n=1 Tax=Paenibacillus sp. S-38 TaxID=3416710 RepID=UPI003CE989D4